MLEVARSISTSLGLSCLKSLISFRKLSTTSPTPPNVAVDGFLECFWFVAVVVAFQPDSITADNFLEDVFTARMIEMRLSSSVSDETCSVALDLPFVFDVIANLVANWSASSSWDITLV